MLHRGRFQIERVLLVAVVVVLFVGTGLLIVQRPIGAPAYYTSLRSAVASPEAVEKLALINKGLSAAPDEIANFRNLRRLVLTNNSISDVPEWLCGNTQIVEISLDDNMLK